MNVLVEIHTSIISFYYRQARYCNKKLRDGRIPYVIVTLYEATTWLELIST